MRGGPASRGRPTCHNRHGSSAAAFRVWSRPIEVTTTEVFLKDSLAEALAGHADRMPEALDLLGTLRDGWDRADATGKTRRVAVRGLTGSSRAWLVSWLQRRIDKPLL